jgi:hypothetical protein
MTEQRPYDQVLADAVRVLTEAARRTISWTDGDGREHHGRADFAEFVTHAVAGAAANLGGIEEVLAGRPGSWEADYVRQMLHSMVGYDEDYLLEHRTEPLTITVAVDNLLNDLGVWQLYDEAESELQRREEAIGYPTVTGVPGTPEFAAALAHVPNPTAEQEQAQEEIDRLRGQLDARRQRDWAAYGQAFQANALRVAGELFPNLPVEVEVHLDWVRDEAVVEPASGAAFQVWERARKLTPLPGAGIPLSDYRDSLPRPERGPVQL